MYRIPACHERGRLRANHLLRIFQTSRFVARNSIFAPRMWRILFRKYLHVLSIRGTNPRGLANPSSVSSRCCVNVPVQHPQIANAVANTVMTNCCSRSTDDSAVCLATPFTVFFSDGRQPSLSRVAQFQRGKEHGKLTWPCWCAKEG